MVDPQGGVMVFWTLNDGSVLPDGSTFTVQRSRPGDEWEIVASSVDACWYHDPGRRDYGIKWESMYRVLLVRPGMPLTGSRGVAVGTAFPTKRDWLNAREVARGICLDLTKGGGREGALLIRRRWGTPCPVCRDFVTGVSTSSTCQECAGTGFIGGYHPALPYWIKSGDGKSGTRTPSELGMLAPVVEEVWGVATPPVSELDLWVDGVTSHRYEITSVASATEYIGVPLTWKLRLARMGLGTASVGWSQIVEEALVGGSDPVGSAPWSPSFDFSGED